MSETELNFKTSDTTNIGLGHAKELAKIADKFIYRDANEQPTISFMYIVEVLKVYESLRDNQSHERKRLIEFFMFFRDYAEHFIGLSIEQFIDKFYEIDLLYKTPFPDCSSSCEIVKILGVGECESVCNHKFDADGNPLTAISIKQNI